MNKETKLTRKSTDHWSVYIIEGTDGNYYTGITTDVVRRWREHCGIKGEKAGAKYFRGRKPKSLVFVEKKHDRSSASKREAEIKKMTRKDKKSLLYLDNNCAESCFEYIKNSG